MQHFDGELEKLVRAGIITMPVALAYSTNPGNLQVELADYTPEPEGELVVTA